MTTPGKKPPQPQPKRTDQGPDHPTRPDEREGVSNPGDDDRGRAPRKPDEPERMRDPGGTNRDNEPIEGERAREV